MRACTNAVPVRLKRSDGFQRFSEIELIGIGEIVRVKGHDGPKSLDVDTIMNIVSFRGRKGFQGKKGSSVWGQWTGKIFSLV